ncbi:alpha/beta fold hydrolase [Antrihabitans cavernicola]|uniref:Alpha/beta hydrolase n=1 Tax=Antrihabitans cavernicola TaxID=2495913 RepID=A0A5A7SDR0_9NOCA|nr:alpha/beta hydrolase [Spelaeibacter cavernicola]KAA0022723.1 alpha/beta hydrolase [Spelaeibacter cavernicola]
MTSSRRPDAGISYDRRGSGSPIVLLHGIGSRWQVFEPILDELARTHETVAIDLPGFGDSPSDPTVTSTVDGFATWLTDVFAGLGIEHPHVVGNSMGGGIALELGRRGVASQVTAFSPVGFWTPAERNWARSAISSMRVVAGRLPAVAAFGTRSAAGRTALFPLFFGKPWKLDPDSAQLAVDGLVGATMFTQAREGFDHYDLRGESRDPGALKDIPVTIAWGTRDAILPPRKQSVVAREQYPFARHIALRGCGHLPFSDDPALCAGVVLATPGR